MVQKIIKDQQADLLQSATNTAISIVDQRVTASASEIRQCVHGPQANVATDLRNPNTFFDPRFHMSCCGNNDVIGVLVAAW